VAYAREVSRLVLEPLGGEAAASAARDAEGMLWAATVAMVEDLVDEETNEPPVLTLDDPNAAVNVEVEKRAPNVDKLKAAGLPEVALALVRELGTHTPDVEIGAKAGVHVVLADDWWVSPERDPATGELPELLPGGGYSVATVRPPAGWLPPPLRVLALRAAQLRLVKWVRDRRAWHDRGAGERPAPWKDNLTQACLHSAVTILMPFPQIPGHTSEEAVAGLSWATRREGGGGLGPESGSDPRVDAALKVMLARERLKPRAHAEGG